MRARDRRRLFGQTFKNETVKGDFRCAVAYGSEFGDMVFDECNMGAANFNSSTFVDCTFRKCILTQSDLRAGFKGCLFEGCHMDLASFEGSVISDTRFVGGRAEYSSFRFSVVENVLFDLQLHGADLRFDKATGLDYGDSNLWGAAITVSCANFKGARFSQRQIDTFLALLTKTEGNDGMARLLEDVLPEKTMEVVDILSLQEVS